MVRIQYPSNLLSLLSIGAILILVKFTLLSTAIETSYNQAAGDLKKLQQSKIQKSHNIVTCKCVIFRLDDIQDYWLRHAQLVLMNEFLSMNQSLTLGIVMDLIESDLRIIDKARTGKQDGLFELAVHGWKHINYTTLSWQEQKETLLWANTKIQNLFGSKSNVFIPPYNAFNDATIEAMTNAELGIISSNVGLEIKFDNGKSIFIDGGRETVSRDKLIYHVPETVTLEEVHSLDNGMMNPVKILSAIQSSILTYGYAVVTLHPQDFVMTNKNGTEYVDIIDSPRIAALSELVESLLAKNIQITSFSELLGLRPQQ